MGNCFETPQQQQIKLNKRIKDSATTIISFTSSYESNKSANLIEQQNYQQSSSTPSISLVIDSLKFIQVQIETNKKCNEIIQIPNFIHSLNKLSSYKHRTQRNKQYDKQTFTIRRRCRQYLFYIYLYGDEFVQSELISIRYAGMFVIAISTASLIGEKQNNEIYWGLHHIYWFLKELHKGRNNVYFDYYPSFPPQPLLAKICIEQIEEEGGNEEAETYSINNEYAKGYYYIKEQAEAVKRLILNYFINRSNPRPRWYDDD